VIWVLNAAAVHRPIQSKQAVESFRMNIDINTLVDADRGFVGRSIYIDPQIYEQE